MKKQLQSQLFGFNSLLIIRIKRHNGNPGIIIGYKTNKDNIDD